MPNRPKSRERGLVHVHVHMPANTRHDEDEPPGYSGHNGGKFDDAGYAGGRGQFGFRHDVLQGANRPETGE